MTLEQIEAIIAKNLTITDQRLMDGVIGAVMDAIAAARAEDNEAALLAKVRKVWIVVKTVHNALERDETIQEIVGVFRTLDAAKIGANDYAKLSTSSGSGPWGTGPNVDLFSVKEFEITEDATAAEAKFQAAHDRAEKQLANNRRIFHGRF